MRLGRELLAFEVDQLTLEQSRELSLSILSSKQRDDFERELEMDFLYTIPGLATFEGNVYKQRSAVQAVFCVKCFDGEFMKESGAREPSPW